MDHRPDRPGTIEVAGGQILLEGSFSSGPSHASDSVDRSQCKPHHLGLDGDDSIESAAVSAHDEPASRHSRDEQPGFSEVCCRCEKSHSAMPRFVE
mmetsp:Transcript_28890/g.65785  ORF Transcript_28890/g.65785 Transcript_28890/m.65785 type:complete len:96 (-) Transcript_28890:2295-2582(-)